MKKYILECIKAQWLKSRNQHIYIYINKKLQVSVCACIRDVQFVRGKKKNVVSNLQSEQLLFFYILCETEVKGCADILLILLWVVALFMCNYRTNLCTPSTSIDVLRLVAIVDQDCASIEKPISSASLWFSMKNIISIYQTFHNFLPKSEILFSPVHQPSLNMAVSRKINVCMVLKCMCMLKYPWFIFVLFDTMYSFLVWFFKWPLIWIRGFVEIKKKINCWNIYK